MSLFSAGFWTNLSLHEHTPVCPFHTVAAGFDSVALDAWACTIFDTVPDEVPAHLRIAEAVRLGTADFRSLQPIEVASG